MKPRKALFAIVGAVLAVSPLAAGTSSRHQLVGALKLVASPKSNVNLAAPFDLLEAPNVTLPFDIALLGGKNRLSSTFEWSGKTKVGLGASWGLAGPGEATADWDAGKLVLDLPLVLNCNGVRVPLQARFTSEAGSDAFGSTSGSVRKLSDSSAEVHLVASVTFFFNWKDVLPNGENKREEFVTRISFDGRLEALNGGKLF